MTKFVENIKCTKLTRTALKAKVDSFVSAYEIKSQSIEADNVKVYHIIRDGKEYTLKIYTKNVCDSGWFDKPEIKRIQIPPLTTNYITKEDSCFLLAGICRYNDKDLMVVWGTPGRYRNYTSIRSAYLSVYSLNAGYLNGFVKTNDNENEYLYICDKEHFKDLLDCYIMDTFVEDIKW